MGTTALDMEDKGVPRLDGGLARSKFDAPMLEPKVFRKQMCWIEESFCEIFRSFRAPPMIRLPPVARHPGHCSQFDPPRYAPDGGSK